MAIHPGFIAAPIAGLAAFGAVHAFTSNPLLLELGVVDKKPPHGHGHGYPGSHNHHHHEHDHHHHHPILPVPLPVPLPQPQPYPPYPGPGDGQGGPGGHGGHGQGNGQGPGAGHGTEIEIDTKFPFLRPIEKPVPDATDTSKPWWSPFAAIIPRLRLNDPDPVERDK